MINLTPEQVPGYIEEYEIQMMSKIVDLRALLVTALNDLNTAELSIIHYKQNRLQAKRSKMPEKPQE